MSGSEFELLVERCFSSLRARKLDLRLVTESPVSEYRLQRVGDVLYPGKLPPSLCELLRRHDGVRFEAYTSDSTDLLEIYGTEGLVWESLWLQNCLHAAAIEHGEPNRSEQYVSFGRYLDAFFSFATDRIDSRCPPGEYPIVCFESVEDIYYINDKNWDVVAYSFDEWLRRSLESKTENPYRFDYRRR